MGLQKDKVLKESAINTNVGKRKKCTGMRLAKICKRDHYFSPNDGNAYPDLWGMRTGATNV